MRYDQEFLTRTEETHLLGGMAALAFEQAQYKEWQAKRRIVSYGGRYDFTRNRLLEAEPLAAFLHPLRQRIAQWSAIPATQFNHALVSEYRPGTALGWHRDAPDYECIVGVSLQGVGRMRLRPYPPLPGNARAALTLELQPRSIYILRGPSRWQWQHAISPTPALRYSITLRTVRETH